MKLLQIYRDQDTDLLVKSRSTCEKGPDVYLTHLLPGNGSQVSYEPAEIFGSYSVMVASCWES